MKVGAYTFHEGKEPKDLENEIKKLKKQLKIAKRGINKAYKTMALGCFARQKAMEALEKAWERIEKLEELEK